jgi:hypothetical protein
MFFVAVPEFVFALGSESGVFVHGEFGDILVV